MTFPHTLTVLAKTVNVAGDGTRNLNSDGAIIEIPAQVTPAKSESVMLDYGVKTRTPQLVICLPEYAPYFSEGTSIAFRGDKWKQVTEAAVYDGFGGAADNLSFYMDRYR